MYLKTFIAFLISLTLKLSFAWGTYLDLNDDVNKGTYFGNGYSFSLKGSKWVQSFPPKTHPALKAIYKSPTGKSSLTIRETDLKEEVNLKTHVESWIKDYRKYGLNLLKAKPLKIDNKKGFLIDSEHALTKKVFRQMVFLKDHKSVTLTCKVERKSSELIDCAELIRNFSWNKKEDEKQKEQSL